MHETVLVNVLHQSRTISGIQARVVHDRVWRNAVLVEDTIDWYAQDNQGNVWYLGEIATNFKYDDQGNLIGTNHDGSWETGVSGATPGIQMAATPHVGDRYYQEFRPRVAVDQGDVLATNESVVGPLGTFDGVLKTRDWTVLTPSSLEHKYFAPGLGGILTEHINPHTGEIESSVRLVKATLNGVPVTQVVDPTTFTGASNIGSGNGFAHVAGTTKIRNSQSVFVEGARFGGDIDIRSAGEVGIRNSQFNTRLSVRAADAASLQSVVANGDVFLYGNMNVTVNKSNLRDEFEIDLGRDNNAVVVTESKLVELQIDGHEGANTLDLDDATIVAELDLFRIERI